MSPPKQKETICALYGHVVVSMMMTMDGDSENGDEDNDDDDDDFYADGDGDDDDGNILAFERLCLGGSPESKRLRDNCFRRMKICLCSQVLQSTEKGDSAQFILSRGVSSLH